MKGDYSQPGLMPGRYLEQILEQIVLPSAYLGPVPSLSLLSTEFSYAKAYSLSCASRNFWSLPAASRIRQNRHRVMIALVCPALQIAE
jgi:hypothetical protein